MVMEFRPAIECEKTLLGGLLLDSSKFEIVKEMLCINDFYFPDHQNIFKAICEVQHKRGSFDIAMVANEGELNIEYLYKLAMECPSTANLKAHAEIIREKSVQRMLIQCAKDIEDSKNETLEEPVMVEVFVYYKGKNYSLQIDLSEYQNKNHYLEVIRNHVDIAKNMIDKEIGLKANE
jgi:replicative DNA helicase